MNYTQYTIELKPNLLLTCPVYHKGFIFLSSDKNQAHIFNGMHEVDATLSNIAGTNNKYSPRVHIVEKIIQCPGGGTADTSS